LDLTRDHFALFGLDRTYDLDVQALHDRYRELQRVVHPDRYASAPDQERRLAMQEAVRVNEAFQVLKDPLQRAVYLLGLHGIDLDRANARVDPAFLMEQMELREALEAVPAAADPHTALEAVLERIQAAIEGLQGRLSGLFARGDEAALAEAVEGVRRYQFLDKLRQEAEGVEARLEETG